MGYFVRAEIKHTERTTLQTYIINQSDVIYFVSHSIEVLTMKCSYLSENLLHLT